MTGYPGPSNFSGKLKKMNASYERIDKKSLVGGVAILFITHFVVDSHGTFFAPLIPLLREKFQFSLATAGMLISVQSMTSAISQPLTALLIDRWPRLPWLPVGIVGCSIAFTSIGWMPTFWGVALAIPVGGIFFGLCHPDMASRSGSLSPENSSLAVSLFVTGGRLGFAFGPIICIAIVTRLGLEWLWIYVFVALGTMLLIVLCLPRPEARKIKAADSEGLLAALTRVRGPIGFLFAVAVSRAIIMGNLGGFLPTIYVEGGLGLWAGGIANTVLYVSGAAGVLIGGFYGDRIGKRTVILTGLLIGLAGMTGFLILPLTYGFFLLVLIGVGNFIPMGVSVAYAQSLMPEHRGFASSIFLGGGWFISAFTSAPIAAAAEYFGLLNVFWVLPLSLAIGIILALKLPREA
jgi:FSR family fosmidomycin resistance protein-like MFS transporter